jgi:uncharacterized protein (DUF1800 family)
MTALDVSRLLGRVAFGATAADLDRWTGKPYADLVDELLSVATMPALPRGDDAQAVTFTQVTQSPQQVRQWWLERMRTTSAPLLERMTLVWHNHFATGLRYPPDTTHLMRQNATLRTHALGNLRDLVAAVTVDPAMLYFLNGHENATPEPNENYAREFFELFTLGVRPQVYTERDVREAARAFTGWIVDGNGEPQFVAARHDARTKKVLGRTIANAGAQEYERLVDVALAQPVASRFLARKLVASLAYVPAERDTLVDRVAATLRRTWSIADALRLMLLADDFRYASVARGRQYVRTPVETVVHAAKALNVSFDPNLVWQLDRMGHSLFDPVDVSGWPLGAEWVTPVTAMVRYDTALTLWSRANGDRLGRAVTPFAAPSDTKAWARLLGLAGLSRNTSNAIGAYLRRAAKAGEADKQAGVLALILSSPEWAVM